MDATTIREIRLRPPPGCRFSIWEADCVLQFQKGREKEVIDWLYNWIEAYIVPMVAIQNGETLPVMAPVPTDTEADMQVALHENKSHD